jgi:hypothetical protein
MTITPKQLVPAKAMETSQTGQYTATGATAMVDSCTVTNTGATNISFSFNIVDSGGSAGSSNLIIKTRFLAPAQTDRCAEMVGKVIPAGSSISTIASASGLTLDIAGREKT